MHTVTSLLKSDTGDPLETHLDGPGAQSLSSPQPLFSPSPLETTSSISLERFST